MITNIQIFTTQLTVSLSTRFNLCLVFYSLLHQTQLQKWLAVNDAFPFGKHCDFFEGIACLRTGTSF